MAMYKPDRDPSENDPDGQFAHTLMHEFTHAFVARYRTDVRLPTWLGEGVAEIVSYRAFPRPWIYGYVRDRAKYLLVSEVAIVKNIPEAEAEKLIAKSLEKSLGH